MRYACDWILKLTVMLPNVGQIAQHEAEVRRLEMGSRSTFFCRVNLQRRLRRH